MDELFARFVWALDAIKVDIERGLHDKKLAAALGTNFNTLQKYRKQKGLLKGEVLHKLVHVYGFNPQWLMKGEGEPFPGARKKYPAICGAENGLERQYAYLPERFRIPEQITGRIADNGAVESEESEYAFREDRRTMGKGVPATSLCLMKYSGDAMEPTFLPGDMLKISTACKEISPAGGLYALTAGQEIIIRRVQDMLRDGEEEGLKIVCDNPRYEPIMTTRARIDVFGKVIWCARNF